MAALICANSHEFVRLYSEAESYTEADALFPEYSLTSYNTGEMMKFYPTIQLYTDRYTDEFNFEYHDINIPADAWNGVFSVAGYKTTDIKLHFAYKVIDGVITHKEEDTLMYGAQYDFAPVDSSAMVTDFKNKLSSLYGYIDETGNRNLNGLWEFKWWIWKGLNNTAVSLTLKDNLENDDDMIPRNDICSGLCEERICII